MISLNVARHWKRVIQFQPERESVYHACARTQPQTVESFWTTSAFCRRAFSREREIVKDSERKRDDRVPTKRIQ